jgi:uncharacterized protein involved in cysteine biosynthesis
MPFSHDWAIWRNKILWQLVDVGVMCACAWVGGFAAFRIYPKNYNLKTRQYFWMAGASVFAIYFAIAWLPISPLISLCLVPFAVAFATVQTLGRWIASRHA